MIIREGTKKDLNDVMAITHRCINHMESQCIHQWDEIYPDRRTVEHDIEKGRLYIVEVDLRCCAAVAIDEEEPCEYKQVSWIYPGDKILVVHRLCVDPAFQGHGIAGRLMHFVEQYAEENGYGVIRLDAFTRNPAAVRLYEGRGYRKAGIVSFRKGSFYCFEKGIHNKNWSTFEQGAAANADKPRR